MGPSLFDVLREARGSARQVEALRTILQWICRKIWPDVEGFFLDVPRVIDHAWRHAEYRLSAECDHEPAGIDPKSLQFEPASVAIRPLYKKPAFWFFAITVFFASFGPSWSGLCATAPQSVLVVLRKALAAAIILGSVAVFCPLEWRLRFLIKARFDEVYRSKTEPLPPCRRAVCCVILYLGLAGMVAGGIAIGWFLWGDVAGGLICVRDEWNLKAIGRLLLCIAVIGLFAWRGLNDRAYVWFWTRRHVSRVEFDVVVQFLLLALIALVQWFGLSTAETREASDLPYRHVFLLWAPSIALVVAFAPCWAYCSFRGAKPGLRSHFRKALKNTELFFQPKDPALTVRTIVYALIFAPVSHILQLLLFPALVAIAVPEDWLDFAASMAFLLSLLLVVWGNMSPRWQELNTYIERWFLRGTPRLISLFVIVIAILRLVRFGYVSTLLDAVPFGTVFSLVVMNYALFWLAEYWMNRAAAVELLRLLGKPKRETYVHYEPTFGALAHPEIHVDPTDRYLASHGTGRFVVLGNVRGSPQRCRAFQSYYLTETFALLDPDKDSKEVAEVVERTGTYFLGLNIALIAVATAFLAINVFGHGDLTARPVVTESLTPPPSEQLVDLAKLLQQHGSVPVRPAIVVVGSGGGTRAALYTTSVLQGLHRLGADGDVVLVSGVSGGGVALAYFAANKAALTQTGATAQTTLCPNNPGPAHSVDDEWDCFVSNVKQPFIEDVLNGATEWRIFADTGLSALLVESFKRSLFGDRQLGSIGDVAVILNTTVVSHPAEESAELKKTLNAPISCDEAEQVFKLMSGGRLIFTNLRDLDALQRQAADTTLPDVHLPYHIVRDPNVRLARAAALNANFPPVFPAALVKVPSGASAPCPRSFYVTDGGAEENLGLISALYALDSALAKLKAEGAHARPIHIVIAEASASEYDYSQDRGVSVLVGGGPSARLAGGLTRELRARVDAQLQDLNGAPAAVRYHFLGLPLAFRSRGGFGTHWLYAQSFTRHDPRPRPSGWFGSGAEQISIKRKTLEHLWSALHDPKISFCDANFDDDNAIKVKSWICVPAQGEGPGRDLHMAAWQELVRAMTSYQKP